MLGVAARAAGRRPPCPTGRRCVATGGAPGPRHQHLADAGREGLGEVHLLLPLGRDGERGGRDVALPGQEPRDELVARHRDRDDVHGHDLVAELLVQLLLEGLDRLVGDPDLAAAVDEVEDRVLHGEHADDPPLHHAVEVALERLHEGLEARRGAASPRGPARGCRRAPAAGQTSRRGDRPAQADPGSPGNPGRGRRRAPSTAFSASHYLTLSTTLQPSAVASFLARSDALPVRRSSSLAAPSSFFARAPASASALANALRPLHPVHGHERHARGRPSSSPPARASRRAPRRPATAGGSAAASPRSP